MRRFGIIWLSLLLGLYALPVTADTVSMVFTGPSGNNSGGVYTYPYHFTVNGTPNVPLMCDDFKDEISSGQSWQATVTPIGSAGTSGGMFAGESFSLGSGVTYTSQTAYDAAGLIYLAVLNQGPLSGEVGTLSSGLANWAVWNLLSQGPLASAG